MALVTRSFARLFSPTLNSDMTVLAHSLDHTRPSYQYLLHTSSSNAASSPRTTHCTDQRLYRHPPVKPMYYKTGTSIIQASLYQLRPYQLSTSVIQLCSYQRRRHAPIELYRNCHLLYCYLASFLFIVLWAVNYSHA